MKLTGKLAQLSLGLHARSLHPPGCVEGGTDDRIWYCSDKEPCFRHLKAATRPPTCLQVGKVSHYPRSFPPLFSLSVSPFSHTHTCITFSLYPSATNISWLLPLGHIPVLPHQTCTPIQVKTRLHPCFHVLALAGGCQSGYHHEICPPTSSGGLEALVELIHKFALVSSWGKADLQRCPPLEILLGVAEKV
ncbi:hypothetical protein F5144DRAFT_207770 [Chaetomium tenue]|uniref:Uncharacterized protein n=1 Tax=Chaetomium tenue TaxID=1854479 RepID=A0ACB7PDL5_9PEZI|nr:hypothetical protein F5144DRAFT_207770 [Chaetomium globosum]